MSEEIDNILKKSFDGMAGPGKGHGQGLLVGGGVKTLQLGNLCEELVKRVFEVGVGVDVEGLAGGVGELGGGRDCGGEGKKSEEECAGGERRGDGALGKERHGGKSITLGRVSRERRKRSAIRNQETKDEGRGKQVGSGVTSDAGLKTGRYTRKLEGFDGEALGVGADGDEGDEGVGAGADDGEVVGGFVDDKKHGGLGARVSGREAHGGGSSADGDGLGDATVDDVEGNHAAGGAIGNVHFRGFRGEDAADRSEAEEHGVTDFVGPRVDDLEAVGAGGDDVEFAAIGLEEKLRRSAGEFEIGDEDGALEIDDGEAGLRAAHNEGEGGIWSDGDFVGLRDDGDGAEELKGARVVNGEHRGAAIDDENVFGVGSEAGLDGVGIGVSAAVDLAGGGVDSDELIGAGGGGVDAVASGREIERVRGRADGDADELIGARVENEEVASDGAGAPDFVALGVFAEIGDGGADGDFGDGVEGDEIDDGKGAVGGGDVGVHVEIGAEEGGAMLTKDDDDGGEEEEGEGEIEAWVFGVGHGMERG